MDNRFILGSQLRRNLSVL